MKDLGLAVSPLEKGVSERLGQLSEATLERLREQGMVEFDVFDAGQGMKRHMRPLWSVRTIYCWTQTFPAGNDVIVEHRYTPSVGGSAQTIIGSSYATKEQLASYDDRHCLTDGFVAAAKRLQSKASGNGGTILTEQRLEYILTTGANWLGTIGKFRLTVDKGAADNLVSFCMDGVRKISPTQFVVEKQDFYPGKKLDILILRPVQAR